MGITVLVVALTFGALLLLTFLYRLWILERFDRPAQAALVMGAVLIATGALAVRWDSASRAQAAVSRQSAEHANEIERLQSENDAEVARLKLAHDSQLASQRERLDALSKEIKRLHGRLEEVKAASAGQQPQPTSIAVRGSSGTAAQRVGSTRPRPSLGP